MGLGLAGIARTILGVTTHRWATVNVRLGPRSWVAFAVAFMGLWAYQQQHADFIIHARI